MFFRLLVAIPRLSCFFSVSPDHTSPDMSALGIQHEYIFLKSNSKLQSFFLSGNSGLQLNPHCDSLTVTVFQLQDGNKQEGVCVCGGGGYMQTHTQAPTIKHTHRQVHEQQTQHKDTQTTYK